jgi:2-polyprenyl-6-hydroxyphenyl methylase/3-demethylubiquinone-9 3-methyltransferase
MNGASLDITGYPYANHQCNASHGYLVPAVRSIIKELNLPADKRRAIDLGCGNGAVSGVLADDGYDVTGVDPSEEGIVQARAHFPRVRFEQASAYDDLAQRCGTFPVAVSLEVVEHVYFPRTFAATLFGLLEPGGTAIVSTPYHGYWKNLVMALSGKMDAHFTVLWDHGHIKFWSFKTLTQLLEEAGFRDVRFVRVGRVPPLAKSMIAIARKPESR